MEQYQDIKEKMMDDLSGEIFDNRIRYGESHDNHYIYNIVELLPEVNGLSEYWMHMIIRTEFCLEQAGVGSVWRKAWHFLTGAE